MDETGRAAAHVGEGLALHEGLIEDLERFLHVCSDGQLETGQVLNVQRLSKIGLPRDRDHLLLVIHVEELKLVVAHALQLAAKALSCAPDQLSIFSRNFQPLGLTFTTNLDGFL